MSQSAARILILDDDPDVACAAQMLLRRRHGAVATLGDPARLASVLEAGVPDVVLLDLNFTPGRIDGAEGLAVLDRLRAMAAAPAVIVLTAYADVPLAVEALKRGAGDFITKPWDNARLLAAVDAALARRGARSAGVDAGLMGDSPAMQGVKAMIASVAPTMANVMVLGENGVGKDLVARAIHAASSRAHGAFLAVDMGALPEATFESEMFGHRRGAFTDARSDRAGRFQAAHGGTLFLDEVGNMPLGAQAKLLTALERRQVTPVGADRAEPVDVRIVSATNLDEASLFDAAVFRTDLLFRLNTIVIRVPPLRERRGDIPALLHHYLSLYESQYGRPVRELAPGALELVRLGLAGQCAGAAPRLRTRGHPRQPSRLPCRRFRPGVAAAAGSGVRAGRGRIQARRAGARDHRGRHGAGQGQHQPGSAPAGPEPRRAVPQAGQAWDLGPASGLPWPACWRWRSARACCAIRRACR